MLIHSTKLDAILYTIWKYFPQDWTEMVQYDYCNDGAVNVAQNVLTTSDNIYYACLNNIYYYFIGASEK